MGALSLLPLAISAQPPVLVPIEPEETPIAIGNDPRAPLMLYVTRVAPATFLERESVRLRRDSWLVTIDRMGSEEWLLSAMHTREQWHQVFVVRTVRERTIVMWLLQPLGPLPLSPPRDAPP